MRGAIKSKRRAMAMFCGHLAVEKMLKGLCAVWNIVLQERVTLPNNEPDNQKLIK